MQLNAFTLPTPLHLEMFIDATLAFIDATLARHVAPTVSRQVSRARSTTRARITKLPLPPTHHSHSSSRAAWRESEPASRVFPQTRGLYAGSPSCGWPSGPVSERACCTRRTKTFNFSSQASGTKLGRKL